MRASRFLIASGLILIGLCAAWPFRAARTPALTPKPSMAPLELTLRRPDSPLELAARTEVSPASGLETVGSQVSSAARSLTSLRTTDLADLAPPPALPISFQPVTAGTSSSDWRPEPAPRNTRPQGKPRPYRIRDGDTLERIAERLLGNRERGMEIFEANREALSRPDLLPVGVTIMLPPREQPDDLEPVNR